MFGGGGALGYRLTFIHEKFLNEDIFFFSTGTRK